MFRLSLLFLLLAASCLASTVSGYASCTGGLNAAESTSGTVSCDGIGTSSATVGMESASVVLRLSGQVPATVSASASVNDNVVITITGGTGLVYLYPCFNVSALGRGGEDGAVGFASGSLGGIGYSGNGPDFQGSTCVSFQLGAIPSSLLPFTYGVSQTLPYSLFARGRAVSPVTLRTPDDMGYVDARIGFGGFGVFDSNRTLINSATVTRFGRDEAGRRSVRALRFFNGAPPSAGC